MRSLLTAMIAACLLAACSAPRGEGTASKSGQHDTQAETTPPSQEKPMTASPAPAGKNPVIEIETSLGTIQAELWPDKAPLTVESILKYVDSGFYDGTIFHRVMPNFMIQGGGFDAQMKQKATKAPVKNEARTDVPNERGTLAMARTNQVDSATAQFFINHAKNDFLNHKDDTPRGFGYCVFGKVTDGMDVVDKIAQVRTQTVGMNENVPVEAVKILSIKRR